MSTPRLLCICRVSAASRRTLINHQPRGLQSSARYQSTKQNSGGRKGFRLGRLTVYTLTASGLVAGGALAYANYDPVFKNQVDELVPGFARWADTAADLFVERTTGHPHPVPSSRREDDRRTSGRSDTGHGRLGEARKKAEDRKTDSNTIPAVKEASEPQPDHTDSSPTEKETATNQKAQTVSDEQEKHVQEGKGDGGEVKVRGGEVGGVGTVQEVGEEVVSSGVGGTGVEEGKEEAEKVMRGDMDEKVQGGDEKKGKEEAMEMLKSEGGGRGEKEGKDEVEKVVEEVRGEVEKVEKEVREERVREAEEVQMADQKLDWLRDSAQVEGKLDGTLEEFLTQTARVEEAQSSLLRTTREHSRLVREVTGSSVDEGLDTVYETADAVQRAEEAVQASREALMTAVEGHKSLSQSLSQLMDQAVDLGLKSKVAEIEERVRACAGRLTEGSTAVQQAEVERQLLQDYHRQAQKDREQLQRELGGEVPEGDSRQEAVLVMLAQRVEVLKEKLKGLEKEHQQRLTAALDQQKESLDQLAQRQLEWSLRDKERELQQELSYQADKVHREYQSELREQLKRQTDSHKHLLTKALNTQAEQLAEKWSGELEVKLTEQENHYQKQLALALSRLRGIEYVVNTIAAAGNETKRQQGMKAACDSLHTALKSASACVDPDEHFSFQREVAALRDAARSDPFILVVLDSLPTAAVCPSGGGGGGGIQGEGGLRERFAKVKRVCRRVALVPETGGGMGSYALSYLQSVLTVSWRFVGRVTQSQEEDKDLDKLDTFEILERADACMRQGDMDLAVRYVNLLRGVPRRVARDWLCDARNYLETLQAVHLVSDYMAALNITSSPSSPSSAAGKN